VSSSETHTAEGRMNYNRFMKFYRVGQTLNVLALLAVVCGLMLNRPWIQLVGLAFVCVSLVLLFYIRRHRE
jgi:hypothetical protein